MKKQGAFLVTSILLLISSASHGQKVIKDNNSRIIIDSRNMPPTTITAIPKTRITNGTNSNLGSTTIDNLGSAINNGKVYHYLEVSKADMSTSADWLTAVNTCTTATTDGGGWRLPTQRELMLIWILRKKLEKTEGFTPFVDIYYWGSTESNGSNGWFVGFNSGGTSGSDKKLEYRVRCVRDITP